MEDKLVKLHTNLTADGYKLGTVEDFRAALNDSEKSKKFFENLKSDGYNLGDNYDSFANTVGVKKKGLASTAANIYDPPIEPPGSLIPSSESSGGGQEAEPLTEGLRADGTKKGKGFLGELKRPNGDVSTEISIGVPINGKETEIPTLVPTLTESEKQYLLNTPPDKIFEADPKIYKGIHEKAVAHAESRIAEGKSPFADEEESPKPKKEDLDILGRPINIGIGAPTKKPTVGIGELNALTFQRPKELLTVGEYLQTKGATPESVGLSPDYNLDKNITQYEYDAFNTRLGISEKIAKDNAPEEETSYFYGLVKNINIGTANTFRHLDTAAKALADFTGLDSSGAFGRVADYIDKNKIQDSKDVPDDIIGDVLAQVGQLEGLFLEMLVAPELGLPKLAAVLGVSGALDRYAQVRDKDMPTSGKVFETAAAFSTGATMGAIFTGIGLSGGFLKNIIANKTGSEALGYLVNMAVNSIGFTGVTAAESAIAGEEQDKRKLISSAIFGGVLTIPEAAKLVWGSSVTRAMNTTDRNIKVIDNAKIEPNKVLERLEEIDKQIESKRKEQKIRDDFDTKIIKAQEKLKLDQNPEVFIGKEADEAITKIADGEPVTNNLLKTASDQLYGEYKRLGATIESQTRKFTTKQIEDARKYLGETITKLEDMRQQQTETGEFVRKEIESVETIDELTTAKTILENTLVTNAGIQTIKENPKPVLDAIQESDITDTEKKIATDKVNSIVVETDPAVQQAKPLEKQITKLEGDIKVINDNPKWSDLAKVGKIEPIQEKINDLKKQAEEIYKPPVKVEPTKPEPEVKAEALKEEVILSEIKDDVNNSPVNEEIPGDEFRNTRKKYIPFEVVEEANKNDNITGQTAKQISQRGGYSSGELDSFLPNWRERVVELNKSKEKPTEPIIEKPIKPEPETKVEPEKVEPIKPPTDVKKEETQEPAGTPEGTETKAKEKEAVVESILEQDTDLKGNKKAQWMEVVTPDELKASREGYTVNKTRAIEDASKPRPNTKSKLSKFEQAIAFGEMTAGDAKAIIESAGIKVPKGIEDLLGKKEAVVAEINSLPLTHVEGQGMDAGAGKGTYLSTEPGNRYATDKAPAKPATVNIKNPFVIEGIDHMIEEAQRRGIKKGADTRKMRDNLIAALEKEGHDAVYFKESGSQEGELYVMDRKNVVTEKPAPVYTTQSGIDIRNDGGELTMVDAEGKEIPATLDRTRKNKPVKGKQRPDTKYKVKNPKYQEAIDEYAKVADLDIGESAFKEAEEVPTDIDRASVIADKSNNPREIAEAFVSERDLNPFNQGDPKEEAINKHIRYVVGGSAQGEGFNSPGSFVNNSDISNVTPGMTLKWFRKDGQTLDQVADYANGEFGGEEIVTPKDVADFIIKYPSRDFEKSKENPNLEKLRIRFEEITGLPLDDVMVNRIERDRAAKMEDMPIDTDVDSKLPQHIKERIDEGGITLENVNDVADLLGWEGEIKDNVLKYLQNEQARRQAEFDSSQEGEDIPGQGEQMEGEPEAEPAPERKPGKLEKEYNDKIKSLDRELAAEKKRNTWLKNNIAKQKTKQGEMFGEEKPEAPPEGMFEEGVAKDFSKENVERMLEDSNGKLRKLQEDRLNLEGKRDQAREADESQGDLFEDKAQSFDDWLNSFKRTKPLKDETDTMGISDDKLWNDFIDAIRELIKSAKKLKTKAEEIFNKIEGLISEFRNSDLYMNATPKERSKADRDINDIRDRVVEEVNAMQKEAKAGGAESFDENIASRLKEIGDMNPMEFPEIVRLATELGAAIRAKKLSPNIRGKFVVNGKEIDLSYDLFKEGNEVQLAKTLAHEIGHLVDFIPDETMSRGNILGRIASLHHFLKTYLPFKKGDLGALTKEDIDRFKEEAKKVTDQVVEKEIDEEIVTTTGLTPEDVLAVWNTATGSGIKTLEDFVKGLNAQQMKSIIKQAFKGNIADELKHLITEKRTKTGKKIKITEIIKGDWKQKLKSLIIEEIKKRKLWDENVIYDELYEFSKKWRPFDEVRSPASFVKYRKSSKEIYADAISGLLNSPGTLLADAPHFYNAFFNYIAEKPEFAEAYLNLMDMVRDPLAVNEARLADMYEGFNEAIEKLRANILDKAKFPKLNPWNNFVQNFISDVAVGIKGLPRTNDFGVVLSPKHKVRNSIEMMRLVDNEVYVMAEQFRNEIWGALEKVGVSSNDFDAILTTERQLADRLEKANPLGWQGQTNQDMKDFIYSKFTPEQAKVVDQVKQRFHEIVWGYVERLYKEGGYTEKAWKESIEPFKDTYATYWIVDYIEKNYISAGLIQVTGTLKKHASPSLATAVKMASVIRLTAMQRAKNNLITELKKSDPDNIKDGIPRKDKFGKKTGEFKDVPGMKPIFYYNEGVWSAVQVDPWVAEVFEKLPPQDLDVITSIAREFNQIFKPVVTKYNPGFAFVTNIVRDYKQSTAAIYSIMQANKSTRNRIGDLFYIPLRTIAGYPQSIYQGSKLLRGNRAGEEKTKLTRFLSKHFYDQKLIDEMIRVGAFSVKTAILNNYDPVESQNDAVLFSKFGFGVYKLSGWEAMRKRNQFFNFLGTVLDGYETAAGGIEVASKINSYKVLKTRIKDAEALGFYVRNFTGTPNFNEKAKKTIYTNNYFPFSNVIAQGLRTVAELATSPNTAGAYWMYKTLWAILPAILSGLAESGAFGDELKKALGRIGSYFNFNYMTIPLGQTEDGKEAFIAIPQDEVSRILYGIARNATMAIADNENYDVADLRQLLQIGAGMTPSISPLASITGAWFDFAVMGGNPYDRYYGGAVVPRTEFEAGGWAATRPMVDWTLKTAGLRDIVKMYSYDPMTNSTAEFSIMDLPALNRAIRYSDRGVWEQYNKEIKNNDKDDARKILEEEKVIGDKVVKLNAKDYKVVNFNSDALEKYKKEVFPDGIRTNSELELWNSLVKKLSLVIEMRNEIFPNGLRSMDDLERWNKIVKKFSVTVLKGTISPDAVTIKMLINKKSHADRIDILRMYKKNNGIDKTNDLIVFMGKNGIISEDLLVAIKQDLK